MEKIAIIGLGVSGAGVLAGYMKEFDTCENFQIDCYDQDYFIGHGYPYQPDSKYSLLNTKTGIMGFDYEKLGSFKNWVESHPRFAKFTGIDYLPREVFGEYLKEEILEALEYVDAKLVLSKINDLDYLVDTNQWRLSIEDGHYEIYDRVHLCCGTYPHNDPYNLRNEENYVHITFPLADYPKELNGNTTVTVIGTNLSAMDSLKFLALERKVEHIQVFSRNNIFPLVRNINKKDFDLEFITLENFEAIVRNYGGFFPFEEFDHLFISELELLGIDFETYKEAITQPGFESLRSDHGIPETIAAFENVAYQATILLNQFWVTFTKSAKKAFIDKYDRILSLSKARIPEKSATIVTEAVERGQIELVDGVEHIIPTDDGFSLANKNGELIAHSDWIVNATGLDQTGEGLASNPFLSKLLDKYYILPEYRAGAVIDVDDHGVISKRFGKFNTLHAHGALVHGALYLTNSATIIQRTSHHAIQKIYGR